MNDRRLSAILRASVVTLICLAGVQPSALAATPVSGTISQDTTWAPAGGPYVLSSDTVVSAGVTLTIEPGVAVVAQVGGSNGGRYTDKVELEVRGRLLADGTAAQPITFGSNASSPTPTDWGGVTLWEASAKSSLAHVDLRHAQGGLWLNASDAAISHAQLSDNHYRNLTLSGTRTWDTTVQNSAFARSYGDRSLTFNPGSGILLAEPSGSGVIAIEDNEFEDNFVGITIRYGTTAPLRVTDNVFRDNTGAGMRIEDATDLEISRNAFVENALGISSHIYSAMVLRIAVEMNDFVGGSYAWHFGGSRNLAAPNNYWGTSDASGIEARIYDGRDDFVRGMLDYEPPSLAPVSGIDATPPQTTIDTGPSGTINSTSVSFAFAASESGSTFECKLDGPGVTSASYGACSSSKSYSSLGDGTYTFSVRATDTATNTDQTPATRTFTVDTTPPQTTTDTGSPEPTMGGDPAAHSPAPAERPPSSGQAAGPLNAPARVDTDAPAVDVVRTTAQRVGPTGIVLLRLRPFDEDTRGTVVLRHVGAGSSRASSRRILARQSFSAAQGQGLRLSVRLTQAGRRTLQRRRKLPVRVTVVAQDAAGNRSSVSFRLTLRAARS